MNLRYVASLLILLSSSLAMGGQTTDKTNPASTTASPVPPSEPQASDTNGPATNSPSTAVPNTLKIAAIHYIQYPSLNPITAITVTVGTPKTEVREIIRQRAHRTDWNCASPQFYKVAVVDSSLKELRVISIRSVHLIGSDPTTRKPYTSCDAFGHPTRLDLILGTQPKPGDLIQVFIYDDPSQTKLLITSDGKLAMTATNIPTFSATPQAAPGESLNNGATRTVGQLSLAFADPVLAPHSPVNLYAKTTDLLSTDGKDTKSSVSLTGGMQRGLFPRWYSPIDLEQTLQGNQTAKNLSAVTSLGFSTLPPWHWAHGVLLNDFIFAPLPPEPTIANLYTHRFAQLVTAKTPRLAENDYTLNGSFSWDTISFPFTCKLLFWERPGTPAKNGTGVETPEDSKVSPAGTPVTTPASFAAPPSKNCLGAEIDLGGWYLPLDHTTRGTQKAEGYGDASILIPLSDFSFATNELTYVTKTDSTKFQVRIKYTDAVNQSNNYARTRGWTFGIEALK